ncbi:MAG: acyl-CoA dehydrogenase family protein [Gammaproteobacteria bacterium]
MHLKFDPQLEQFRQEVRAFVREHLPAEFAQRARRVSFAGTEDDSLEWLRILDRKGWGVPHWPIELGGTGWSPLQLHVFHDELARADAPELPMSNLHMVGPVVYTFGTAEQKERFLPAMRRGDYFWAQGFSEPGSGSDLVSLRTTATRDGDDYIVRGQKIWTSGAHRAKWVFMLVKTDTQVKPQLGISFLLVDLSSPGITVRPIQQINGEVHLCEVFFDDVRVPANNLVGEPGKGWSYAKFLLDHERTASSFIYWNKAQLRKLKAIARAEIRAGRPLIEDRAFRARITEMEARVQGLDWSVLRMLAGERSDYNETARASALKIRGSELQQEITELQLQALGHKALRYMPIDDIFAAPETDAGFWPGYSLGCANVGLMMRASTIYGGTKQVQKNILAKLAFGL